jgi:uncharacterized protein YbjT (DUF2867 family)
MKRILVTGATGYLGGLLIPELIAQGYSVRCMVRDEKKVDGREWIHAIEVVEADVLKRESLAKAMADIDAAYYLIHSMAAGKDFHEQDLLAAKNFSQSAEVAGVKQLIYLGGLGNPESDLSVHLRSRQETGNALRESNIPVTEFRAAVIVGSGSISFEMIRYLTERVPVMICPTWVYTKTQPIAVTDVINYLLSALQTAECLDKIIEIGGADVITYKQMMLGYAKVRGLKRSMIPVPVLTPALSSYWVHLVTPIASSIAKPLINGLKNEVVVRDNLAKKIFPHIRPKSYDDAVWEALSTLQIGKNERGGQISNLYLSHSPKSVINVEGLIIERRKRKIKANPEAVFTIFSSLGGQKGWLYMNWTWQIRGVLDSLVGGVGMRRGRRHPDSLKPGEIIDFWCVEEVKPEQFLRLRSEMKLPGLAWLQFETYPDKNNYSILVQSIYFAPKGLTGVLYWYLLYPFHHIIFNGLMRKIGKQSEAL